MSVPRQKFTPEFKHEAVRLIRKTKKSCAQLGIPPHYVVRWKQQWDTQTTAGRPAFTGRRIPALSLQEARLKERELEIACQGFWQVNWEGAW